MKKILTLAALLTFTLGQAQIGGGLLNKAKDKAKDAVDKPSKPSKGGSNSTNTGTDSDSPSSSSKPDGKGKIDKSVPTNDLKAVIGAEDLFYSSILAQNYNSTIILPDYTKLPDYRDYTWMPNAVNVFRDDKTGKLEYCYFLLIDALADPNNKVIEKITTPKIAFEYKYKGHGIFWNGDGEHKRFENMWFETNAPSYRTYSSNFVGYIMQPDGNVIIVAVPRKPKSDNFEKEAYINDIELGYQPSVNDFDFTGTDVEVLTKTEAAAKSADLNAAKTTAIALVKKALENADKTAKEAADKKLAAAIREKRGMVNAGFEKTMLTYIQENFKNGLKYPDYWAGATIGNIAIISKDWYIVKNDIGLIIARSIDCEVVVKHKGRCYTKTYVFEQAYAGGGNYSSSLEYTGNTSKFFPIACDKAK